MVKNHHRTNAEYNPTRCCGELQMVCRICSLLICHVVHHPIQFCDQKTSTINLDSPFANGMTKHPRAELFLFSIKNRSIYYLVSCPAEILWDPQKT